MLNTSLINRIEALNTVTYCPQQLVRQFISHGADSWSPLTTTTRQTHLKQLVEFLESVGINDVRQVRPTTLEVHFHEYLKTHAKSTTNTHKRAVKVFLDWLHDYKEINIQVQSRHIRSSKDRNNTPKSLSNEIIKQAIAGASEQDALMIAVCVESGARISELTKICVDDIRGNQILIHGKGSVDRFVYVTDRLAAHLRVLIRDNDRRDRLFVNTHHGQELNFCPKSARLHIQRAFQSVGVKMVPHQLRHTFAVNLLENGCDIVTIQRLLGHRYMTTTQEYLRVADGFISGQFNKYSKSVLT